MSEENLQTSDQETVLPENKGEQIIQLKINRENNELSFLNPITGRNITVKALIQEEKKQEEADVKRTPLTPEEFRAVLNSVDALGLTWSADIPPRPRFKKGVEPSQTLNPEYHKIQKKYPNFPRELAGVILVALMENKQPPDLVGNEDELKEKVAALRETLITPEYRSEFFFKHAIKVPYFEDADWEIVIKAFERAVKPMPKSAYALLSLVFRRPVDATLPIARGSNEYRRPDFVTVAVNEYLLNKLITLLTEAKAALSKAQQVADLLDDQVEFSEVKTDESRDD